MTQKVDPQLLTISQERAPLGADGVWELINDEDSVILPPSPMTLLKSASDRRPPAKRGVASGECSRQSLEISMRRDSASVAETVHNGGRVKTRRLKRALDGISGIVTTSQSAAEEILGATV